MYTIEQKLKIVQLWYETKSPAEVRRRFNTHQGYKSKYKCAALTNLKIQRIVQHFEKEKTLDNVNKGRSGRRSSITPEKREQVRESVVNSPKKSYRIRAQELALSPTTLLRVMRKDLKLFPFRISTHHVLQQQDKEKRIEMCSWLNEKLEKTPSWLNHIWFSDEAHFHLNGAVNNHNNVFWGEEKPEEIGEKRLKGPKVTAFVAFNAKHGLLGPYWFEENGRTVTINSERYIATLDQLHSDLTQKLTQRQLRLAWFMQDGARPHTAHASLDHLRGLFRSHLISLNTDHEWAPHSPDLNPLDFWFWGAAKGKVYANRPQTLADLKQNVVAYAAEVTAETWKKVGQNFCVCVKACFNRNGAHIKQVDCKKLV